MDSLVSVIIPTYNRSNLLVEAIQSVQKQTYSNLEIIVVDDWSSDNTETVVNQLKSEDNRIRYFCLPKKGNGSIARNYGLQRAKGKYISFLDSDDLYLNEKVAKQVYHIEHGYDFVICNGYCFDENGVTNEKWRDANIQLSIQSYLSNRLTAWGTPLTLWRKELLYKVGGFNEELENAQEWEMHFRALLYSENFLITNDILVAIRDHNDHVRLSENHRNPKNNYNRIKCFSLVTRMVYSKKKCLTPLADKIIKTEFWNLRQKVYSNGEGKESLMLSLYQLYLNQKVRNKSSINILSILALYILFSMPSVFSKDIYNQYHPITYSLLRKIGMA